MIQLAELRLQPKADRRLRAGHVWIYSNEINTKLTPLNTFSIGQCVNVINAEGKFLGSAYINPNTLLCARLYARHANQVLDAVFLKQKIEAAWRLRKSLFHKPFYRLVYGESDGLPGLVVDRFDEVLVMQTSTAGMEQAIPAIVQTLQTLFKPRSIVLKNDSQVRAVENLESYVRAAHGDIPDEVCVEENEAHFTAPLRDGQKTGWFFDHRLNRQRLAHYVKDKRVLDVFSYVGGWGIQAAVAGARSVMCVDASALALEYVARNAKLNHVAIETLCADAFEAMKKMIASTQRFDVIVLDPPAFIKRKKDMDSGRIAYKRINEMAMRLLSDDGILVSASCSMHLSQDELVSLVRIIGRERNKTVQLLEVGHQGPDHPVHLAVPETAYIKSLMFRVIEQE